MHPKIAKNSKFQKIWRGAWKKPPNPENSTGFLSKIKQNPGKNVRNSGKTKKRLLENRPFPSRNFQGHSPRRIPRRFSPRRFFPDFMVPPLKSTPNHQFSTKLHKKMILFRKFHPDTGRGKGGGGGHAFPPENPRF